MLREKGLFLSVHVDDTKIGGNKKNLKPMCDLLMEQVDLEEPTSVLDHVYLVCSRRECKPNLKIGQEIKDLLEPLNSPGTVKQLLGWERVPRGCRCLLTRHEGA